MSSEKIIKHCAPTLAGIKTANLFNEFFEDKKQLIKDIRNFNQSFAKTGIKMFLVAIQGNRALLYVYRVNDLKHDLAQKQQQDILRNYGYNSNDIYKSLRILSNRVGDWNDFPHEIGLFLGYPPEDVKGFIENKGANYKTMGYWKVYGDEKKASETFEQYRICRKTLLDKLKQGFTLKQLVIQK